jgi:uncharacterized membrane protein
MDWILLLKFTHVMAAIVAVGANVTYSFWITRAGRDTDRLVWTLQGIRRLDRLIANPAYVVLLITGVLMILGGHFSFRTSWIEASLALYVAVVVIGIVFYAPALRRQIAEAERDPGSPAYAAAARRSNVLGIVTTVVVVVIVALMVFKPSLW